MSTVGSIFIVARLTLREALRRRLLWALAGLTVPIVVLTWWGFAHMPTGFMRSCQQNRGM